MKGVFNMAKKKKVSKTVTAYNKVRQLLKRRIKRLESRGYILPDNIIPDKPKRITQASVRRLEKITLDTLYKKAYAVQLESGEILSGQERRKQERSEASKKAAKTRAEKKYKTTHKTVARDNIIFEEDSFAYDNSNDSYDYIPSSTDITLFRWLDTLEKNNNGQAYTLLRKWYDDTVAEIGRDATAQLIEEAEYNGTNLTREVCYNGDEAVKYIAHMKDMLPSVYNKREFLSELEEATLSYNEPE